MLVLTRKLNESIMIGDQIEVMVLEIREGHVKIGIKAPRDVTVHRQEVYAEIRDENLRARTSASPQLDAAAKSLRKRSLKPKDP
ncbi:MAG: carbon storage regulator [Candidatus Melainabacteria bacterium HGW-Melainabacteria-1]|nr:MAG: carbon storage regulator [Candidatus Melainabacteria bacterium HGW-Melainabacteria-1]